MNYEDWKIEKQRFSRKLSYIGILVFILLLGMNWLIKLINFKFNSNIILYCLIIYTLIAIYLYYKTFLKDYPNYPKRVQHESRLTGLFYSNIGYENKKKIISEYLHKEYLGKSNKKIKR